VLILIGCILCGAVVASSSPAVVTIGEGYINVETGNAGGIGGNNNNKSVTSE